MRELAVGIGAHQIDIRAGRHILRLARANLEIHHHPIRSIDQVVAVSGRLRERRELAGPNDRLATVLDQNDLALENKDQFILM